MKVVFDTNVVVSAFVTEGVCSKLLRRARRGQFQLITCPFILKEFEAVLSKKLSATKGEIKEALRVLSGAVSVIVHPSQGISGECRDPNDDNILSCSIAAGADYLVTGDSDLLDLRKFRGTVIITPRDFEMFFEE